MSSIVNYYKLSGTDDQGRSLIYVLEKDHDWLEDTHDYIQWVFPTREMSCFNPNSPLVTQETIENFDTQCYINLIGAANFFAFRFWDITASNPFWVTTHNHNFLRISRFLDCLNTFNLTDFSVKYLDILESLHKRNKDVITENIFEIWKERAGLV